MLKRGYLPKFSQLVCVVLLLLGASTIAVSKESTRKEEKKKLKECVARMSFWPEVNATRPYTVLETVELGPFDDIRDMTDFYFGVDREKKTKKLACKLGGDAILLPNVKNPVEQTEQEAEQEEPYTVKIIKWVVP